METEGAGLARAAIDRMKGSEAAAYVGLSESTLQKFRLLGKGPRYVKLGGRVFYQVKDLDAYIQRSLVETTDSRAAA